MDRPTAAQRTPEPPARLRVLASGSGGNCTLVHVASRGQPRRVLIDAGLSPRRTRRLLAESGVELADIDAIVLTHLDSDHLNAGWRNALPASIPVYVHRRHAAHARNLGFEHEAMVEITDAFELFPGVRVDPLLVPHDELGVAAYRFSFDRDGLPPADLGFATDVGRVSRGFIRRFQGVEVLAIESNYCPRLQRASDRPEFLKRRIMGGSGHLSNQESAKAVAAIAPREHVVLLHLSRQCNSPELAAREHSGGPCPVTIASQFEPTRWVSIGVARADANGGSVHEASLSASGVGTDRPGFVSPRMVQR
ncbi:MAG: MBL fold metallo-hydrolase [Planctomycetes bacterium]|nr:MBL fold metallo-hydrolase [Planctomycetota bacterium]